jgi:NitT/TauT family transport system ATP-binding protein
VSVSTITGTSPTRSGGSGGAPLRINNVTKVFGRGPERTVALEDVTLTVERGEFLTVVGASGCGKSTLLNLIARLDQPTMGQIVVDGKVALMFQEATLLPWLTAQQNVELALKLAGTPKAERSDRAESLLELVRLEGASEKRPHELSGGMKQRVALARTLAQDASIVLMDEPFGALDAMTRDRMHDEIERIWTELNLTIVFVTHNMREAVRLGDRVVLLKSRPGQVKSIRPIELPRPRRMDSAEVAGHAAALTDALSEEVAQHVG